LFLFIESRKILFETLPNCDLSSVNGENLTFQFQYQLAHNPLLLAAFCTTILSIAFFNFAGISVTKEMSATTR
jgi:hypothetical protein